MGMEMLAEIFEVCIIPLLTVLTAYFIKFVNAKSAEIGTKVENETQKKYLEMLNNTITDCVIATTQTYVDSLKKQGAFDAEAQKIAFMMTYESVVKLLTDEATEYLNEAVGDLQLYITQKIEAEVNLNKTIIPE
jgi:hypothetical protein